MYGCPVGTSFDDQRLGAGRGPQDGLDICLDVSLDLWRGHLLVPDFNVVRARDHRGVDLFFGTEGHVDKGQKCAHVDPERAWVVPLVGAEIEVEIHRRARRFRTLGGEEGGAAARLLGQAGTGKLERPRLPYRGRQHVVYGDVDICRVVAVVDQRKGIGGLDAEHHGAGAPPRFARHKTRFDPLGAQEVEDKVAYLVVADAAQQGDLEPQAARADGDVGRASADVSRETFDLFKGCAHVVRVEVDRRAAHRKEVIGFGHQGVPF